MVMQLLLSQVMKEATPKEHTSKRINLYHANVENWVRS
jgi:hypothetical protein